MPELRVTAALIVLSSLLAWAPGLHADADFRDPTRPWQAPVYGDVAAPRFELNAIFSSSRRHIAIVNGQRVTVGSEVDGATVTAISKHAVTLEIDGAERTLAVRGAVTKQ